MALVPQLAVALYILVLVMAVAMLSLLIVVTVGHMSSVSTYSRMDYNLHGI